MASDAPVQLLAAMGGRRFGPIDVVRITPAGSATRRESLFDRTVLTQLPWSGIASLVAWPRRSRRASG